MAKTLVRPSLYDQDFLAWTEQQAALVRAGRLDQLDRDNLAEELDTMGRSEWGELENRVEVLLMHMLKWDHQPARRSRGWKATMREQRNAIRRLMRRGDVPGRASLRGGRGPGAGARGHGGAGRRATGRRRSWSRSTRTYLKHAGSEMLPEFGF
jgi:hypothetical protein